MIGAFSFVHANRTYACHAEERQGTQTEKWWWFTVSHDGNRYAPFQALARDTRASIQSRIVAYYANHLAHRAMTDREHWARRSKAGVDKAAVAKAAADKAGVAKASAAKPK